MSIHRPLLIAGTRPEVIKQAPIYKEFLDQGVKPSMLALGQHTDLLDSALRSFPWLNDVNIETLPWFNDTCSRMERVVMAVMASVGLEIRMAKPDVVIVQGDTATAYAAALTAFYEKTPVAHVEAGLRTHEFYSPFPEEMHRAQIDWLSSYLFAPTEFAAQTLRG